MSKKINDFARELLRVMQRRTAENDKDYCPIS